MNIDKLVFRVAGIMVTAGVLLAYSHHIAWLLLPLFVGLNMFQASFTGFCPLASIGKRLGLQEGKAF
ncbi:MAG: sulfurtransferase [Myxococcales bacterium SG8_38]|nr:MAG: sulfurtransferase [Myxococcales bacterium SG8_38]